MDFLKDLSLDKVRNLAEDAFNQAKPKTEVEARVYEVLSHKNWGSSSTLLNEIARDSFDYDKFAIISQLLWEALENQRPAAWRVVFKGLTLLEHLVKNGSERCVDDARNHGHTLRSLLKFNYYEGTVDRGLGVREKTKQLVEMLSDDERVREERMKARQMREKLGKLAGVSGGGGGYAGYGNDNWNSGSSGGNGGYGDSGIGSKSSASTGRYGGRYDDDTGTSPRASEPTPTFATIPDDPPVKSKKTKKKKQPVQEVTPSAPAPEVDLFSFDEAPTPAPAPPVDSDDFEFDAFQSASAPTPAIPAHDPFATAPVAATSQSTQFDAFGNAPSQQQINNSFDAFGNNASVASPGMVFQNNGMAGGNMQQLNNTVAFQSSSNNNNTTDDDDFGDFEGASTPAPAAPVAAAPKPSDPLSKLISLDGLTKNPQKRQVNMVNQPIVANAAASQYVQNQAQIHAQVHQQSVNASFSGIDGIHSQTGGMGGMMNPSFGVPQNPSVMGSGADAISTMFDPTTMKQQTQMNQGGNQQMMGGNPMGMMSVNRMGMGQPMGGNNMGMSQFNSTSNVGMMNPMQGGGGMMMGGNNMQKQQQGGMMYGNMNPQQQQQFMMQQLQMMNNNNQGMPGGFGMSGSMNQGGFR